MTLGPSVHPPPAAKIVAMPVVPVKYNVNNGRWKLVTVHHYHLIHLLVDSIRMRVLLLKRQFWQIRTIDSIY